MSAAAAAFPIAEAQQYARGAVLAILRTCPDQVDDVLQDAALNAWKGRGQFDGRSQFRVWFVRVAINAALVHIRQRKSRGLEAAVSIDSPFTLDSGEQVRAADLLASTEPSPFDRALEQERRRILHEAIDTLPAKQKDAARRMVAGVEMPHDTRRAAEKSRRWHAIGRLRRDLGRAGAAV